MKINKILLGLALITASSVTLAAPTTVLKTKLQCAKLTGSTVTQVTGTGCYKILFNNFGLSDNPVLSFKKGNKNTYKCTGISTDGVDYTGTGCTVLGYSQPVDIILTDTF